MSSCPAPASINPITLPTYLLTIRHSHVVGQNRIIIPSASTKGDAANARGLYGQWQPRPRDAGLAQPFESDRIEDAARVLAPLREPCAAVEDTGAPLSLIRPRTGLVAMLRARRMSFDIAHD